MPTAWTTTRKPSVTNDYRLAAESLCIDAGNPTDPFANEPEDNGDLVNLGLHGNTAEATVSLPGRPQFTAVPTNTRRLMAPLRCSTSQRRGRGRRDVCHPRKPTRADRGGG